MINLPEEIDGYTLVDDVYVPIPEVAQGNLSMIKNMLMDEIAVPENPPFENPLYDNEYLVSRARVHLATQKVARFFVEEEYGTVLPELRTAFQKQNSLDIYQKLMELDRTAYYEMKNS